MTRKDNMEDTRWLLRLQKGEITGSLLYAHMAARQKDPGNRAALAEIARAEKSHYDVWRRFTGRDVAPARATLALFRALRFLLGDTFALRFFEKTEEAGIRDLKAVYDRYPEARRIMEEEERHEEALAAMLDEERLHYVGAMVLGLNDALVELTGAIAGLTFALADTRLVALSGIITGVSATLSMAASNYLAERADGNAKALKSSLYTGAAYLVTVALLVLPYLLLPGSLYMVAFGVMLATVILIILAFNYYISVAKKEPFGKRFLEMAGISLGVAGISFLIGLAAKALLGIEV